MSTAQRPKPQWYCRECKQPRFAQMPSATKALAPGQDPPQPSNPLCPVHGTPMEPLTPITQVR